MKKIPLPIFKDKIDKLSWKKIYAREYGVQYSEMAILCLSNRAKHHIPKPSLFQVVVPEGQSTAFYIDGKSWVGIVESLNHKYTSRIDRLKEYEEQFYKDGENYLKYTKKISKLNFTGISNNELFEFYQEYQEKLFHYSIFAWTTFILNKYVADRAVIIIEKYIKKHNKQDEKQEIIDSLFYPTKKAAVLRLQYEAGRFHKKVSGSKLEDLYRRFKWLSCLDIHNKAWTKNQFVGHIKSFEYQKVKKPTPFEKIATSMKIDKKDMEYLMMAKRFVYIKDARDDFRRQGVYLATGLFEEIAGRMGIKKSDLSYLQEKEVCQFLKDNKTIDQKMISMRKKAFVLYLDENIEPVCLAGKDADQALVLFKLAGEKVIEKKITGMVASRGKTRGVVSIVKGVKDLEKVKHGNILVAVTTHPDYVPVMRKSSAIVTDEGGVTSHAAIVSREFQIPCIVGTGNATKVLKDGDLVDVDAMEGWVKKI